MAATRSGKPKSGTQTKGAGRRVTPKDRKVHLHIANSHAMGSVFEASRKRVNEALKRHPGLKDKIKVTIDYNGEKFDQAMRTADVLFSWQFDRKDLSKKAPNLRWVHAHGAGVYHLMPLDWLPPDAVFTNSRGVHGPKADEYTIMAILMLNNRLPEMATNQRRATWDQLYNTGIEGKTLVVVGVGHVGGGAAKWAKRFGLNVIGIRRSGKPHRYVDKMYKPGALKRVLPKADFVLMAAPHTDDSYHLIGKAELDLMKRGAGLVNYSRAHLIDYEALRKKLEKGELSAVLDVFDPEPLPKSSPLWKTPNLIITPHASSDDWDLYTPKTLDLVFKNMARFIAGKPLLNRVDPKLQY